MGKRKKFNEFRFGGLDYKEHSNQYLTMNRVSEDNNKIVVKVGDEHLLKTTYGYALILDENNVVFIKDWQVSINHYGCEVLLTREYFNVKNWGQHDNFIGTNEKNHLFETWLAAAKEQNNGFNIVKWKKGD